MISASRCNSGGGRTKKCRVVNGGGGYVNHCEQALGVKNEVVMATSKIAVATGGDQMVAVATHDRVYPLDARFDTLKKLTMSNIEFIEKLKSIVVNRNEKIKELNKQLNYTTLKLDNANRKIAVLETRGTTLDVLPFTPVSSTRSSGMGDLNSAEPHERQEPKPKRSRKNLVTIKEPVSDSSEPNVTKRQRTRSAKLCDIGKMQEFSLITADTAYYTCLGNYDPAKDDPVKDEPVPQNSISNLEIPSWRIKTCPSWDSMEGTENMSDDIFENRHSRLELCERKQTRWDMQRLRELRRVEYLKQERKKHHSQNVDKEELTTLLPDPANIKAIEITDILPVSAFGSNLYIKKKLQSNKFYHSQWYNDGSQLPQEQPNVRGLRSSGHSQYYDTPNFN